MPHSKVNNSSIENIKFTALAVVFPTLNCYVCPEEEAGQTTKPPEIPAEPSDMPRNKDDSNNNGRTGYIFQSIRITRNGRACGV